LGFLLRRPPPPNKNHPTPCFLRSYILYVALVVGLFQFTHHLADSLRLVFTAD
jgi:hypothetical protein